MTGKNNSSAAAECSRRLQIELADYEGSSEEFMEVFIEMLEEFLTCTVQVTTILMELFGICILVITAVKCFFMWIKDDDSIRLELAQGIALALEFKMGGEVLRTVIVREWSELGILGAIIVLRGVLTFIIHWEIKNEKKEMEEKSHHPDAPEPSGPPNHPVKGE